MFTLRESLRDYIMNISEEAALTGLPMIRPLTLSFPHDKSAAESYAEAAFMFGPSYLIQPITEFGQRQVSVYLPNLLSGTWIYFFNRSIHSKGGENVTIAVPLEEVPLFILSS